MNKNYYFRTAADGRVEVWHKQGIRNKLIGTTENETLAHKLARRVLFGVPEWVPLGAIEFVTLAAHIGGACLMVVALILNHTNALIFGATVFLGTRK